MVLKETAFVLGLSILFLFPGSNAQTEYNLGTIVVSDTQPNPDGPPSPNPKCTPDKCEGLVWMYYSNTYRKKEFGTLNKGGVDYNEKKIICRQLGYSERSTGVLPDPPFVNESIPVWFSGIDCTNAPENTSNILECRHTICGSGYPCHDHSEDFVISCYGQLHPRDPNPDEYYEGEVFLSPPDSKVDGMQTTFGVIQIKMYKEIRSITLSDVRDITYFQDSKRDSICKQMGFTGAVTDSVYTVGALKDRFNFTNFHRSSWFNINETTLKQCNRTVNTPSRCFGCCYDYDNINPGGCGTYCNSNNALAIACTYDSFNQHPDYQEKGNQDLCEFSDNKMPKACIFKESTTRSYKKEFEAFITISILLLIAPLVAIALYKGFQYYKRRNPENAQLIDNNNNNDD